MPRWINSLIVSKAAPEKPPRRRTVRGKLQSLVLTSVGIAVALVAGVSAYRDGARDAALQASRLQATAQVIASVAAEATSERDRTRAFRALRSISQMPGVKYARVEDMGGKLLAETGAGARLLGDAQVGAAALRPGLWRNLASRTVEITAPVLSEGRPVGHVILLGRSEGVLGLFLSSLLTSLLAAAVAVAAGLAAAAHLQRSVTRPILALTRSMREIQGDHDYSRTVDVKSNDEVGELVHGFNRMLDEVRARDARIADHLAGLERQVADRTADLRVAKDAAESANSAKSDFLATMSHEIRTPMNGIMVMAEMLAAGDMPPRQRRFAEVIAKSGSSLLAIINDILDFSKIEAGKLELERLPVDLCDVVEDVTSLFWEKASSKGLDLAAYVDPATPRLVAGDPTRLRQVIGNLVNNAIKFTETGGVLVEVEPDAEGSVRISVRDTGIGIPKHKIPTVFGAFSQADQSTTRKFGGTGLGLSICKRLVDAMDGRFHVTSELGRGSTFAFRLPVETLEAAGAWPSAAAGAAAAVATAGLSSQRALGRYLARSGYGVESVETAWPAEAALVVADPQRLHALGRAPAPAICLGEYGDSAPYELQRSGLAQAVMIQPLRRRELEHLLRQAVGGEPLSDPAGEATGGGIEGLLHFPGARVLVADDSAVNREVAMEALARLSITCRLVNDGRQAVEAAASERFDLILMDGSMPEMDGYEAARAIRAQQAGDGSPPTPIVALTAHVVGSAANAWREAGMDAVLHKPFTLAALSRTLAPFLVAGEAPARDAAPSLPPEPRAVSRTGVVDPELFDPAVADQLAEMAAAGRGDFVDRIRLLYRENAPASLVQFVEAVRAGDAAAAARAAHALKSMSFNLGARAVATLAGGYEAEAREGRLPDTPALAAFASTLARTLQALGAGPTLVPAAAAPSAPADGLEPAQRDLLRELEKAIAEDQLSLVYQPQFDRDGAQIVGVEALIRWVHPTRGLISPAEFIPLAEAHGRIRTVTDWVIRRLIAESPGLEAVTIAFNVSAGEFKAADFADRMIAAFSQSGVDHRRFEIEITETAVLDREEQVLENIRRLHAAGFKVALDDFGAGYTSLRNLRRIPFDKLKIDQEFVGDCISDVQSASLVHAVVSVGRALGMKVVAEGVETEMQRKFLKVAGVHAMQGYLFSRPVSLQAVEDMRRRLADPLRESA